MPVTNVSQDQEQDTSGNLIEVYTITFTVPNHSGSFTVTVPSSGDPVAAAQQAIAEQTQTVEGIYGL
jgi:hypothetical protein